MLPVGALAWGDLPVWGSALGWLVGSVLGVRRSHVEESMRRAGVARPGETARSMYASLGASALELMWLASRPRALEPLTSIDDASLAAIEEARSKGKGIVFAASHTGNWDLAACAIAQKVPLMVVTKHLSIRWIDRFWQASRAGYGVTLVDAAGALGRGRAHLSRGGAVAMMIDQVPEKRAVATSFLGETAFVDRAPFALAAASGAPLLVSTARRTRRHHALSVALTLDPPARPGPRWVEDAAKNATKALESFVLEHPSEWLWMHRRWKRPTLESS